MTCLLRGPGTTNEALRVKFEYHCGEPKVKGILARSGLRNHLVFLAYNQPMNPTARVLMAGESWMTHTLHVKGFDSFTTSSYAEGGSAMIAALRSGGVEVTYQPCHVAANSFPDTAEALSTFDVIVLSDIGANTLLLRDSTFVRSEITSNRLELLRDYVEGGGALLMIGGYLTFQGIEAKAAYHGTPVEEVLPVVLSAHDDRRENPQGVVPETVDAGHPIAKGLKDWPAMLGYNRAALRPDAHLVATIGGDPLIAVRIVKAGRTAVFSSDCSAHWGPPAFTSWACYATLWLNLVRWLAGRNQQTA